MTTVENDSSASSIPGAPRDSTHDLLTGVSNGFVEQLQLPSGDDDVARLLATFDEKYTKLIGMDLVNYANQLVRIIAMTLGDRPGRRVTRDAAADGVRNHPDRARFERPPRVHSLLQAVSEASASVCTQRRIHDAAFDQQLEVARAEQQQDAHPNISRWIEAGQRALIIPLAPVAVWVLMSLARRKDGWPASAPDGIQGSAIESGELMPFAIAVVVLGVVIALMTASANGAASLRRMLRIERPTTLVAIGAGLSAVLGTLTGVAGTFSDGAPWFDVILGAVVWAVIGTVGFALAFLLILLVINREATDALTGLFSRYAQHKYEKHEQQSIAAKEAVARIHDAALHIVGSRADVLVGHYYSVNLLVRRNSRNGDLIGFVEKDLADIHAIIGNGTSAPCVCTHDPSGPSGGS